MSDAEEVAEQSKQKARRRPWDGNTRADNEARRRFQSLMSSWKHKSGCSGQEKVQQVMEKERKTASGVGRCDDDEDEDDGITTSFDVWVHKMLPLLEMGSSEDRKGSFVVKQLPSGFDEAVVISKCTLNLK